jgi:hypothetical protein
MVLFGTTSCHVWLTQFSFLWVQPEWILFVSFQYYLNKLCPKYRWLSHTFSERRRRHPRHRVADAACEPAALHMQVPRPLLSQPSTSSPSLWHRFNLIFLSRNVLRILASIISSFLIILSSCNFIYAVAILPLSGNNIEIIRHIFMRRFTLLLLLHSRFLLSHMGQCRCVWVGSCCI